MDHMKLVADLCAIIDRQNEIIQAQATELAQHDAVDRAEEIATLRRRYRDAMGEREEVTQI